MSTMTFDEKLHVGNRLMDREHAILIEYINTLQGLVDSDSSRHLVGQVLEGLIQYTKTHFYVEEELMYAFRYPDYVNHIKAHEKFKQTMQQLSSEYKQGQADITNDLMDFLKDWLVNHIQKIDRKLADFLKGKQLD